MIPRRLRLRGLTRFSEEIDLRLDELPPGLIAVVGENGAGKTTIMEAMGVAAIWRELPSRPGALISHCTGPALLEVEIEHAGVAYRIVHQLDPEANGGRGKPEAFLFADGVPIAPGRIPDFDRAVAERFPPLPIVLASTYASQNAAGNFLRLSPGERRDLFVSLLGHAGLQTLAQRASAHRAQADGLVEELARRLAQLAELDRQAVTLRERLDSAQATLPALQEQADRSATEHEAERDRLVRLQAEQEQRRSDRRHALDQRAEHERARATAAEQFEQLEREIERADDASARLPTLRERLDTRRAQQAALDGAAQAWREVAAQIAGLDGEIAGARARIDLLAQAERAEAQRAEAIREQMGAEAAAQLVPEFERQHQDAELQAARAIAAVRAAEAVEDDRAETTREIERAEEQGRLLERVPCRGAELLTPGAPVWVDCGTCELLAQARAARDLVPELRARLHALGAPRVTVAREADEVARAELVETQRKLTAARQQAAGLAGARARTEDLRQRSEARPAGDPRAEGAIAGRARGHALARRQRVERDGHLARQQIGAGPEVAQIEEQVRQAERQAARLDDLRARQQDQRIALEQATQLRDRVVVPDELPQREVDAALEVVRDAEARRSVAASHLQAAQVRVAQAEGAIAQLGDLAAKRADLQARTDRLAAVRAGWVLLERGLGREGVQALEIDAAGPTVSGITNDLLEACYGARFALELRTIREAEGAKKQREVFDVLVHDGRRGHAITHDRLSGGEQVIVDEALKLAIAIYGAQRSGHPLRTLWRDECDGRLDPENAALYPAMLRRAAEIGHFDRVYYVTHRPEVAAQADGRIVVQDGRAWCES